MTGQPAKMVILLEDLDFGGTQRYVGHLLKNMNRRLFSPELWILRRGTDMASAAEESGVPIVWLSRTRRFSPSSLAHLLLRLVRCRPAILYTLTVIPNIWGRIFGRMAGIPAIISGYRGLMPGQHERWLWPLSRRIICNASILKGVMVRHHGVDPGRIHVIPNAVDADFFSPGPGQRAKEPTVLSVGRLVQDKDPENLLEAFRLTLGDLPRARLEILGDGRLRKRLMSRIRSWSLERNVTLLPGTPDIRPHMRRSWVFAMASAREASPNVILEAMASGLPVVATRVGGIPELVLEGRTGLLVEPGNPWALAQALTGLLTNESRCRAMGSRARERVLAHHSIGDMVRRTEEVVARALDEAGGGGPATPPFTNTP